MTRTFVAVAALLAIWASPASAEPASLLWLNATIRYDPAVWKIRAPGGGADLLLTCIAADCPGEPTLYGYAWRIAPDDSPCLAIGHTGHDAKAVDIPATPLRFAVAHSWTGCRALDEPIVEACAASRDTAWRIVSHLVRRGCNHDPAVPGNRLTELLNGIVPDPARP